MLALCIDMNDGHGKTVLVAMSGGVDSSLVALLLQERGYRVVGATLRLYGRRYDDGRSSHPSCCALDGAEEARRVCRQLGIPHYVFNAERQFQESVVDYFCREYARGRTPYPCIPCNRELKFGFLLRRALQLGADYLATGHYARVVTDEDGYHLLKGVDGARDQGYALYSLGQETLARVLMPLGWLTKEQVRHMAAQAAFPNASRPDSQELCFVPPGGYRDFLASRLGNRPGEIVDRRGQVLGEHQGIGYFTVGQRKGLGIPGERPLYVLRIEAETNRLVVGHEEELYSEALLVSQVSYVSQRVPPAGSHVTAKIRYKSPEVEAVLYPEDGTASLRFLRPQRAVTPGQTVVFYRGDEVLGGGVIERAVSCAESPSPT